MCALYLRAGVLQLALYFFQLVQLLNVADQRTTQEIVVNECAKAGSKDSLLADVV